MLLDIAKLPTAENSAIRLHPSDNVAIARVPIAAGTELRMDGATVVAREAIPAGHKIALRPIATGEMVLRYGQGIGRARQQVSALGPAARFHKSRLLEAGQDQLQELLRNLLPAGDIGDPDGLTGTLRGQVKDCL